MKNPFKYRNSLFVRFAPITILVILLIGVFVFKFVFMKYDEYLVITDNGFFVSENDSIDLLPTSDIENLDNNMSTVDMKINDRVYKNRLGKYTDNSMKNNLEIEYPLFVNDGTTIINYNEDTNLIDNTLTRSMGIENSVLSYGKLYDFRNYELMDTQNYVLLNYKNNIFINLYDLKIKNNNNIYEFPINSFLAFNENGINYYKRNKNVFEKGTLLLDFQAELTFYYEATEEEYLYIYEDFLEGLQIFYKEAPKEEPIIEEKEQVEEEIKVPVKKEIVNNFAWVKPVVISGELSTNVYTINGNINITDPADVITKAPTYYLYVDGKLYSKRSYNSTNEFTIKGLKPSTTYTVVGQYTYLDQDLTTQKLVTFYTETLTTLGMDTLEPIDITFEKGDIYSKKIEIKNLKVTSSLESEALKGVVSGAIVVNGEKHYLSRQQVASYLATGQTLESVSTNESLKSNTEYDYIVELYDASNNIFVVNNNTGHTITCSREPQLSLKMLSNSVETITFQTSLKNPDNIELLNYRYIVVNSLDKIVKSGDIIDNEITINDIDPNQMFTIKVYADYDINNGKGIMRDNLLTEMEFSSLPISSLGYLNINFEQLELGSTSNKVQFNINSKKTDGRLVNLLKKLVIDIRDTESKEIIRTYTYTNEDILTLKSYEYIELFIDSLESNKEYDVILQSTVTQGETSYDLDCVYTYTEFKTTKLEPIVNIKNLFVTSNFIDYDIMVTDMDSAILNGEAVIQLLNENGELLSTETVKTNQDDFQRIIWNKLEVDKDYTIKIYAYEYNLTDDTTTYENKKLIYEKVVRTEDGISGTIKLNSALREPTGQNLIDIRSEVKWMQNGRYYNLLKDVDEDGIMHLYGKHDTSGYTQDFSEYVGEYVTFNFKAKCVSSYNTVLYFTNYVIGNTNYKLDVTDEWKEFTFTLKIGYTESGNNWVRSSDYWFGKHRREFVGFYISNVLTDNTAEYLIKDYHAYISKTKTEITPANMEYVYNEYWYNSGYPSIISSTENLYIRATEPIRVKKGKTYQFSFTEWTDFDLEIYFRTFLVSTGKYYSSYGYNKNGFTFYAPEDLDVYVFFRSVNALEYVDKVDLHVYEEGNLVKKKYAEFEYDYMSTLQVNFTDKRNEIENDTYYIRVFNNVNDELIFEKEYLEMVDREHTVDVQKKIELDENKKYRIELAAKIRDRYYTIDYFEVDTSAEVKGISEFNDWRYVQERGHYIFLNDIDFRGNSFSNFLGFGYHKFSGELDFQGHTIYMNTQMDGNQYRQIGNVIKGGVVKNFVIDMTLNGFTPKQSANIGLIYSNLGVIENVMVKVREEREVAELNQYFNPVVAYNYAGGIVRNFAVIAENDLLVHYYNSFLSFENSGTITNGYFQGKNVSYSLDSTTEPYVGLIVSNNKVGGVVSNVYSVGNITHKYNNNVDRSGLIAHNNAGIVKNVYTVGDTNPLKLQNGPVLAISGSSSEMKNVYYLSNNIYTMSNQTRITPVSLNSASFQESVLGSGFDIDNTVKYGYYPHVIFTSKTMPNQEFFELPVQEETEELEILDTEIIEQTNDSAIVKMHVYNPLGNTIDKIGISYLTTEIIDQTFKDSQSTVTLQVSDPTYFYSKYAINNINSTDYLGYKHTTTYVAGDKYLFIDFYREIKTVADWKSINTYASQNFILMNDLDFEDLNVTDFVITVTFSGKLNGDNHTVRNITIKDRTCNGLINGLSGKLVNINFENYYMENCNATYNGIIGNISTYSELDNVHAKNVTIIVGEARATASGNYIGAIAGYVYYSKFTNVSVTNVKIYSDIAINDAYIGGMFGRTYVTNISNCFVKNLDIEIKNSASIKGIGGLQGGDNAQDGIITNAYTTGTIKSNGVNVGGISGNGYSHIRNSYSTVNIISESTTFAGITGNTNNTMANIENVFYGGNLLTTSLDSNFRKIGNGGATAFENQYALKDSLINGVSSENTYEGYGETLVMKKDINKNKYIEMLGENAQFKYSEDDPFILPKVYYLDTEELLPNQEEDEYLYDDKFRINNMDIVKHPTYAYVALELDNPDEYEIISVDVQDANTEIVKKFNEDGQAYIQLNLTPKRYVDSYLLNNIKYKDSEGVEHNFDKNIRLEVIFYKNLSSYEDWQNVDKVIAENYLVTNDIDLSGKEINTGLVFNRLESNSSEHMYKISGINLTVNDRMYNQGIISRINSTLQGIEFSDITYINTNNTSGYNYFNIISSQIGTIKNMKFTNINMSADYRSYVGIFGHTFSSNIENVEANNINIRGSAYVAPLFPEFDSSEKYVSNITVDTVDVNARSSYSGGAFGYIASVKPSTFSNITVNNATVHGYDYVGGAFGYGTATNVLVTNSNISGTSQIGGFSGSPSALASSDIVVDNVNVSGTLQRVGGIAGQVTSGTTIYNSEVRNSTVTGGPNTTHVGGFAGYLSWDSTKSSRISNVTVINEGEFTGGFAGIVYNMAAQFCDQNNITVIGNKYVGAYAGSIGSGGMNYFIAANTTVRAKQYAGGIAGLFENINDGVSYREGYFQNSIMANLKIHADSNAGAYFGNINTKLLNNYQDSSTYFEGEVTTGNDTAYFAVGTGDVELSNQIYDLSRIEFYEGSSVDGHTIGDILSEDDIFVSDNLITEFNDGYIFAGGNIEGYTSYPGAQYSNFIHLEKGKAYNLRYKEKFNSNSLMKYAFFKMDGTIITYLMESSAVNKYITDYKSDSYNNNIRFVVLDDCLISANPYYNNENYEYIEIREITHPKGVRSNKIVLSNEDIRIKNTWGDFGKNTTSRLRYSSSYYTFNGLDMPEKIEVTNHADNKKYQAKVSSADSKGLFFNGVDDYIEIPNFKLDDQFSITFTVAPYVDRGYMSVFSSRSSDNSHGFFVFLDYTRIYVKCDGSLTAFSSWIPLLEMNEITITCDSSRVMRVYVNGTYITKSSTPAITKSEDYKTYIANDAYYSTTDRRYMGYIGKLNYYSRVLTDQEVANNYSSNSITNNTNLRLAFDFTKYEDSVRKYYPQLKNINTTTAEIYSIHNNAPKIYLPDKISKRVYDDRSMFAQNSTKSLEDTMNVYSSSLNTINVEFENISNDLKMDYTYNGITNTIDITDKVYSLYYYYDSNIKIKIYDSLNSYTKEYTKEELMNSIGIYNNNYYSIRNNKLYNGDTEVLDNALNIYNNLVLTDTQIYDLEANSYQSLVKNTGASEYAIPLYNSNINDTNIQTYYGYTKLIDSYLNNVTNRSGQMVYKDNNLYLVSSDNTIGNNTIFNTYNNEVYEIVLNTNTHIQSLKESISIPSSIINTNIVEMKYDKNSNSPIMIIKYDNDSIRAFNYKTGEILYSYGDLPEIPLMSFMSLKRGTSSYNTGLSSSNSLLSSINLINKLDNIDNNEVKEKYEEINDSINNIDIVINDDRKEKDDLIDEDTQVSQKENITLKNNYISSYNPNTGEYDVYSTSDLINPDIKEVKTEYIKIAKDTYLYDYFFKDNINNKVNTNRNYILYAIIALVIINLFVFVYKYQRRGHEA